MTQEDKELLLKDLCARLPYGVKVTNGIHTITLKPCSDISIIIKNEHILPYLRPLSSMAEEERKEYKHLVAFSGNPDGAANFIDWLNEHHFDYNRLIEKGLALEAPVGLYDGLNEAETPPKEEEKEYEPICWDEPWKDEGDVVAYQGDCGDAHINDEAKRDHFIDYVVTPRYGVFDVNIKNLSEFQKRVIVDMVSSWQPEFD